MNLVAFLQGARLALSGFGLIRRSGMRRFVIIPLLINLLVFGGVIAFGTDAFAGLLDSLLPETVGWLEYLLWPLFGLMVLVIGFYTFTLVANLIGAPFNDRLAEKVAERLGSRSATQHSGQSIIGDVSHSIWAELRKWLYFLPLLLGMAALSVVGLLLAPLALIVPVLWFVLGAWLLGFEYLDYPLGNDGLSFADKRNWLRQRRSKVLGFGAVVLGLTMIPIINFFVMPAAVAGATALWASETDEKQQ